MKLFDKLLKLGKKDNRWMITLKNTAMKFDRIQMNKTKSFYLEIVRVIASFYVFINHIGYEEINGTQYFSNTKFIHFFNIQIEAAHCFVLIFFVLSGYLITLSASKKSLTFYEFIISRLGRIYSVLIPALIFSFAVAYFIKFLKYPISDFIPHMNSNFVRFFLNLFFISQSFTFSSAPPFNLAFWSVQYEVIYYFIFACFFFFKGWKRYLFISILLILSFPKVLLLFPIWLLGSTLYKIEIKLKIAPIIPLLIFIITTFLLIACLINPNLIPFQKIYNHDTIFKIDLYLSYNYQADFIFGLLIFINFYSFFQVSESINLYIAKSILFEYFFKKIQLLGNCSYTLYLFHTPLIYLIATVLPYDRNNPYHLFFLILGVMIIVYFIARITEWEVKTWRNRIRDVFNFISTKFIIIFHNGK